MENSRSQIGTVHLVGAGPGDPDLLTLRAARLIGSAGLIVHDGLVDPAILALAQPQARLVSVAKSRARHTMQQEAINALLVAEALAGHDVVRLKGGDPFVFGRGGEEAEACRAAGVPVQIVPGITAATGAAASAQIPLTHRDSASIVSFVAGLLGDYAEKTLGDDRFSMEFNLTLSGLALAVILFILARVFRKGADMRAELEGTV